MDIAALMREINEINTANGWREDLPDFGESMMLLTTECSEAADAWRKHGFTDMTPVVPALWERQGGIPAKPQGVGAEFADIAIRLLDTCVLFDLTLKPEGLGAVVPPGMSLLKAMRALVKLTVRAENAWNAGRRAGTVERLTWLWLWLFACAEHWGIDMDKEIRRKLDHNRTRGWRHGGLRK